MSVISTTPLGMHWPTIDPFLFCAHHDDVYPAGNAQLGLDSAQLQGRQIGSDFSALEGWSMYHGDQVPGFPAHPHRGFETVTIVRKGYIDHSDSLGATARFGGGDVQWLTAGQGVVHCEMFPLLQTDQNNPLELFQIWLNLPAKSKMCTPHFTMFWHQQIPRWSVCDAHNRRIEVVCIAGRLANQPSNLQPQPAPPHSWASEPSGQVGIFTLQMEAGAQWSLPAALPGMQRVLYFFSGHTLQIDGQTVPSRTAIQLQADTACKLVNGDHHSELLMLEGRPIGEPVAQHGPFVMNTHAQIEQAFADYRRTQFGGWPWNASDPTHPRTQGRFAKHADGRVETQHVLVSATSQAAHK